MTVENHHNGIIIPHDRPSMEALQGLIEEFVTRDGTDTGYTEGSLEESVEMVMRQLVRGDVVIVYDETTGTANIVPKEDARSISEDEGQGRGDSIIETCILDGDTLISFESASPV